MENESTIADVSAVHEEADDAAWTVSSGADALVVNGLSKRYDDVQALDNVSLTVQCGHTIGLLGENGAGKTTFIETVIGLRKPDSGTINLMGQDVVARPREVHQKLGIQLQEMNLMPKITVSEYLTLFTDQPGWPGHLARQYLCRAAVANREIRAGLPVGLRIDPRSKVKDRPLLRFLQCATATLAA